MPKTETPLTEEQESVWAALCSAPKQPFINVIRHNPEDISLEKAGVYVIWKDDIPLYIGSALKNRPEGGRPTRMWGLKDRLESHRRGQISGSSLAITAWFCEIAPTLSVEQHKAIAEKKLNPSGLTEEYILRLCFSCVADPNAERTESALYHHHKPIFNEYQEYVRKDRLKRLKAAKALKIPSIAEEFQEIGPA